MSLGLRGVFTILNSIAFLKQNVYKLENYKHFKVNGKKTFVFKE